MSTPKFSATLVVVCCLLSFGRADEVQGLNSELRKLVPTEIIERRTAPTSPLLLPEPEGPELIISSSESIQTSNVVQFTFEWNVDVASTNNQKPFNFDDIELKDSTGKKLQFTSIVEDKRPPLTGALKYLRYFGNVARLEAPGLRPSRRQFMAGSTFIGSVMAPPTGWVQAGFPPQMVCDPRASCNAASNVVRVSTTQTPEPCVLSSVEAADIVTSKMWMPVTFTFSSDVNITKSNIQAYAYSYIDRNLPSIPAIFSITTTGARQIVATINKPLGTKYDHVEVWVNRGAVSDGRGVPVCESNHFRFAMFTPGAILPAVEYTVPPPRVLITKGNTVSYADNPVADHTHPAADHTHQNILDAAAAVTPINGAPMIGAQTIIQTEQIKDEAITHDKLALNAVQNTNLADGNHTLHTLSHFTTPNINPFVNSSTTKTSTTPTLSHSGVVSLALHPAYLHALVVFVV